MPGTTLTTPLLRQAKPSPVSGRSGLSFMDLVDHLIECDQQSSAQPKTPEMMSECPSLHVPQNRCYG